MPTRETIEQMCAEGKIQPLDALATLIDALLDHHLRGLHELKQHQTKHPSKHKGQPPAAARTIVDMVDAALAYEEQFNAHYAQTHDLDDPAVDNHDACMGMILGPKADQQARIIDLLRECKVQAELDQDREDEEKRMLAGEDDEDRTPMRLTGD